MEALHKEAIQTFVNQNKGWEFDQDAIKKEYKFTDFKAAFAFMSRIAFEAEALGHHPEWTNVYNRLLVKLTTHDVGNKVSDKDLALAKRIDELFQ